MVLTNQLQRRRDWVNSDMRETRGSIEVILEDGYWNKRPAYLTRKKRNQSSRVLHSACLLWSPFNLTLRRNPYSSRRWMIKCQLIGRRLHSWKSLAAVKKSRKETSRYSHSRSINIRIRWNQWRSWPNNHIKAKLKGRRRLQWLHLFVASQRTSYLL